jgi:hypothetical protein
MFNKKYIGLVLGPLVFILLIIYADPIGLSREGKAILASTISLAFPSKFGNQVDNTTPEQRVLQRHKNIRRINTDYDLRDNSEDIELYVKQMAELGHDENAARQHAIQFYQQNEK